MKQTAAGVDQERSTTTPARDASRALDALVAEKVMGDVAWDVVIAGCSRGGRQCATVADAEAYRKALSRHYDVGAIVLHDSVPYYSTDIAAAWLVVAWLFETRYCVNLFASHESDGWRCEIDFARFTGVADTAPLAICRAALAMTEHPEAAAVDRSRSTP